MAGLVLRHLMDGVVDGVEVQLLGLLGQIHLAGAGTALGVNAHLQVLLGAVGQDLAQQLGKLGGMLGLLKCVALPGLGDLGIALAVSDTAHGQIHADLATLAVEVLAQTLLDLLGNVLGDADDMLGDVGVVLLLNELGCRGLADRAELGDGTLCDITTNGANILSHKNCLLLFCNCS